MTFFGDALAHAILPGVAVAYLLGGGSQEPLFWGGLVAGVGTALGIGALSKTGQVREDTAIGVIFAGMFALGVALISTVRNFSVDLTHFMFGNVLGVSPGNLLLTVIFGALVLLLVVAFYKEFLVISFDPVLAQILRIPDQVFRYLLLVMLAVTVVISLQTVGVGLMVAMLVTPAATASLLTRRLPVMMGVAALCGATVSRHGPVPVVLRQCGIRRRDRARVHRVLPAGTRLRARPRPPGAALDPVLEVLMMQQDSPENKAQIVYFSHGGGPLPILGDPGHRAMVDFMLRLPSRLRRPDAILVISAHWEESAATLLGAQAPPCSMIIMVSPPKPMRSPTRRREAPILRTGSPDC